MQIEHQQTNKKKQKTNRVCDTHSRNLYRSAGHGRTRACVPGWRAHEHGRARVAEANSSKSLSLAGTGEGACAELAQ